MWDVISVGRQGTQLARGTSQMLIQYANGWLDLLHSRAKKKQNSTQFAGK